MKGKYSTSNRIIISESQYNRLFLGEQGLGSMYTKSGQKKREDIEKKGIRKVNDKGLSNEVGTAISQHVYTKGKEDNDKLALEIKRAKDALKSRGIPSNLIGGHLSRNHVYSQTTLNVIRRLNDFISEKVIGGTKGKYNVCVKGKGLGTCNQSAGGEYYVANNFTELADVLSNKMIGENKAPYVVVNNTLSFNFSVLQKELDTTFKYNKDAYKSTIFPDGWWGFYVKYFGTDQYQEIYRQIKSIAPYEIDKNKETLNVYEKGRSLLGIISDCASDYHCILDVASIATLAIPGVGLIISSGLDFVNAAAYGIEGITADNKDDAYSSYIAGVLTLFGGLYGGGVKQTKTLVTKASRDPVVYKAADEISQKVSKVKNVKNLSDVDPTKKILNTGEIRKDISKIYKEVAEKYGLTDSQVLLTHDILRSFGKVDSKLAAKYTKALTTIEKKIGRANLIRVGKDKKFQKILLENNGDIVVSLKKYIKIRAQKEAIVEGTLFFLLVEAMEEPAVQAWIGESYRYIKYRKREDIRGLVEKEGYNWDATKNFFGSVTTKNADGTKNDDYSKEQSEKDNTLLKKAWLKGWRPWPKGVMEPTEKHREEAMTWLVRNPEYQTDEFKKVFTPDREENRRVRPENPDDEELGVEYFDSEEELKAAQDSDKKYRNNTQPEGEISFDWEKL